MLFQFPAVRRFHNPCPLTPDPCPLQDDLRKYWPKSTQTHAG